MWERPLSWAWAEVVVQAVGRIAGEGQEQASLRRGERVSGFWEEREEAYWQLVEVPHPLAGGKEASLLQRERVEAFQPLVVEERASRLAWAYWQPLAFVPGVEVTRLRLAPAWAWGLVVA